MHILLIGGDTEYVPDMNTDALIIVVVNRETKQVSLLSIPRDLWVYIPDYNWGRINSAHRIGTRFQYEGLGPGLLKRTIEENFGIPIDHWVRISHRGFANLVDALGGVDMIVPCRINLRYQPPASEEEQEMFLDPGSYHFDGATALRYVRTRRDSSDFDRARRQQQFLRAVWDQFRSPDIVAQIPELWPILKDHFKTSLRLGDILALAPLALDLQPQRIRSRYIGEGQTEGQLTPEGWYVLMPIPEKVQQVVASLYAPPSAEGDRAANEGARIQVQNGTGRSYLARIGAEQLRWAGLQVVETGLADRSDYAKTRVVVFNDKPEAVAVLTRLLGVTPENVIHQPDPGQAVDVRVILGRDYAPCR
jgi:LCP family protein required for cell wall assembly